MRRLVILTLSLAALFTSHAQLALDRQSRQWIVSATAGYTIPNAAKWKYVGGFGGGLDCAVRWRTDGSMEWHRLWHMPSMGLRANWNHQPGGIAGERFGLAAFLQSPIPLNLTDNNMLAWELDFGLSAYTKPYELTHAPLNEHIGSYHNCLIQAGLTYTHSIAAGGLVCALKIVHTSNGYLMRPNQGLNYLQGEIGWQLPSTGVQQRTEASGEPTHQHINLSTDKQINISTYQLINLSTENHKRHLWFLSYAPGVVQPRYTGSKHQYYYAHTAEAGWAYALSPRLLAGAAADLMYNFSHDELIEFNHDPYPLPFYGGVSLFAEPLWGPLSLRLALGCYLLKSQQPANELYNRAGLFYQLPCRGKAKPYIGVAMKNHAAHIDYVEWHFGVRL